MRTKKTKARRGIIPAALAAIGLALALCSCAGHQTPPVWEGMEPVSELSLQYAQQFSVSCYDAGYRMLTIEESGRYFIVPEGAAVPEGLPSDIVVLQEPLDCIYLAATSAMDPLRAIDAVRCVQLVGTNADGWYIPEAKQALADGSMLYAGRYSAPDYELIVSKGCDLAIESMMISHAPEVKEQLERLDVPVLIERSSYESTPLGRMEWVKLYGALLGRDSEAQQIFDAELAALAPVLETKPTGKTAAFFAVNSTGAVNVRKSGDYVAEMIRMAGGEYVPRDLGDNGNALATMNIDMESFYTAAKDADILIYNSTIDGELTTIEELLQKSAALADFKAVREGNVWCTGRNLFQESMSLGRMIAEFHAIFTETDPQSLIFLHRLV